MVTVYRRDNVLVIYRDVNVCIVIQYFVLLFTLFLFYATNIQDSAQIELFLLFFGVHVCAYVGARA